MLISFTLVFYVQAFLLLFSSHQSVVCKYLTEKGGDVRFGLHGGCRNWAGIWCQWRIGVILSLISVYSNANT